DDPDAGEIPVDLEAARMTIDIINMLAQKTRGNLNDQEDELIREALASLQMLYFRATGNGAMPAPPPDTAPPEPAETSEPAPEPDDDEPEDKQPRFRKTYD
ncbi:MAG: DUF1844 domain-containing protein, partial [Verrucomicrobiota bacterium]